MKLSSQAAFLSAAAFTLSACDQSDGQVTKPAVHDVTAETTASDTTDATIAETASEVGIDTAGSADAYAASTTEVTTPTLPDVPWAVREAIDNALDAQKCLGLQLSIMPATHPLSHVFAWGKSTKTVQGLVICQDGINKTKRLAQMGEAPSVKVRTLQALTKIAKSKYNAVQHIVGKNGLVVTQADDLNENGTLNGEVTKVDLVPKDGDTCEIIGYKHAATVGDFVEQYRSTAGNCTPLINKTTAALESAWNNGGTKYGINP